MTYFCTNCWKEIGKDELICRHCGADQNKLSHESFIEKLIRALNHPEPETPIRAAYLLGKLKAKEAVPHLVNIIKSSNDPFIRAEAIRALGEIQEPKIIEFLETLLEADVTVIERHAVQDALQKILNNNKFFH